MIYFRKSYRPRELNGSLMFGNGVQLLAALSPARFELRDLGLLQGLSNARNKYEHGFLPKTPSPDEVRRNLDKARAIVARAFGEEGVLDGWIAACQFPVLEVAS